MADFTWCMAAIDWGWPIEETAAKLPEVSEKARERLQMGNEGYPLITTQDAAAEVKKNDRKPGQGLSEISNFNHVYPFSTVGVRF
jgi:hypothetical protein